MSNLPNPKYESFARDVALFGMPAAVAYERHVARPGSRAGARNGAKLLLREDVAARIAELSAAAMDKAAELAGVDRARALAEQARIAYSNILDFIEIDEVGVARMKSVDKIPRDKAASIQAISYDAQGRLRIKLHDKVGALTALLRATEAQPHDPPAADKPAPSYAADDEWGQLTKREQPVPVAH